MAYTLDKNTLMVHHITLCNWFLGLVPLQVPHRIRKKAVMWMKMRIFEIKVCKNVILKYNEGHKTSIIGG
jgi:hypothetical protein